MSKINKGQSVKLWGSYVSTILSIALVLLVLGLLLVLGYHSYCYTKNIKENIIYNVVLSPDVAEKEILELKQELEQKDNYPYIKAVNYISKDEAAKSFAAELGDNFVDFLGYNPLFPSLEVKLKSNNISSTQTQENINLFVTNVKNNDIVTEVVYQEVTINEVNDMLSDIGWILIIFISLLLFISVVLINNTIKIAIYSKRYTIKTMQLVGAKRWFIISPFLKRSVLYGLFGAFIAIIALIILMFAAYKHLNASELLMYYKQPYMVIGCIIVAFGIAISSVSTYISIIYYLNRKDEQLY